MTHAPADVVTHLVGRGDEGHRWSGIPRDGIWVDELIAVDT
jgi:hypothetical protein